MRGVSRSLVLLIIGSCVKIGISRPQQDDATFLDTLGLSGEDSAHNTASEASVKCGQDPSQLSDDSFLDALRTGCQPSANRDVLTHRPIMLCERKRHRCTPYHLCDERHIVSDGKGAFDLRINKQSFEKEFNILTHSDCTLYGDVCCSRPHKTATNNSKLVATEKTRKCGHRNVDGVGARILGLKNGSSQFGEFPWMAAITRVVRQNGDDLQYYVSGGSLIHPQVVLTSAHNIHQLEGHGVNDSFAVVLGEWDTRGDVEPLSHINVKVSQVIKHPQFNPIRLSDDVALMILEHSIARQSHIDLICLPDRDIDYSAAADCVTTGWGKERYDDQAAFQTVLKLAQLSAISHQQCEQQLQSTRLGRFFKLDRTFVCAGGGPGDGDACLGDGGSPLACLWPDQDGAPRYVQLGVVSWGLGCGREGVPGVYADVAAQLDWINAEIDKIAATS